MQKMELLLKLTPADDVKSDVLPLLFRSLESNSQQLQELCLSVIPTFAALIDYPAMKNALIPRIKKLCISTNHTSVSATSRLFCCYKFYRKYNFSVRLCTPIGSSQLSGLFRKIDGIFR